MVSRLSLRHGGQRPGVRSTIRRKASKTIVVRGSTRISLEVSLGILVDCIEPWILSGFSGMLLTYQKVLGVVSWGSWLAWQGF